VPVWQRNLLVWRKLAFASILGNIADPLLYMLALGYGLGSLVGEVGGMPYIAFIGTGMVCQSAMFTASFEGMYSAFSRMHVQRTWEGIINAPIALDDVVLAEWMWTGTKAVMSTTAILAVIMALGYGHTWLALWILPLGFLVGLVFGAFGLVMNALAPGYDFFTYFFTLVITPMLLLSGVYFPVEQMPAWLAAISNMLPLKHAIDVAAADARARAGEHPAAPRGPRRLRARRLLRRAGADAPAAPEVGAASMLIVKSLHIVFMVTWFAGLFYLPRLFVYHAQCTPDDRVGIERFKVMERKLYRGIMTPAAVLTIVFGSWLWLGYGITGGWLHAKVALVALLLGFHFYLGKLVADFAADRNVHGHVFYRWLNEIPALPILIAVVLLVVLKPF
jgi:lipooligosaccharide transport system permease protein